MPPSTAALEHIGQAVLPHLRTALAGGYALPAREDPREWASAGSPAQAWVEVLTLIRAPLGEVRASAEATADELAGGGPDEIRHSLMRYLTAVPGLIRQMLRRPADPTGTTIPSGRTRHPADVFVPLLPGRAPQFEPGELPGGAGDWELVELLCLDPFSETWVARNPDFPTLPPALLRLARGPGEPAELLRREAERHALLLGKGKPEALAPLRQTALSASPPCLQYGHPANGTATALLVEAALAGHGPPPAQVSELVRRLADTLGILHRLDPPQSHGALGPAAVIVRAEGEDLTPLLIDLGSRPGAGGDGSDPGRDVQALGLLWYQLLTGDLAGDGRGEEGWKRKATDAGMSHEETDLLSRCLAEDPARRPADAGNLAEELAALAPEAVPPEPISVPVGRMSRPTEEEPADPLAALLPGPSRERKEEEGPRRARDAREELWGKLDTLGEKQPELAKSVVNSVGMKFVLIPAGKFRMGSPAGEAGRRDNEGPDREVMITRPFYLAAHPVTQAEYMQVMGKNPARFNRAGGGGPDHPVEMVSWDDAVACARALSALPAEKEAKREYRLPTEAEWECACRAGTTTPFHFGPALDGNLANFDGNYPYGGGVRTAPAGRTTPVGSYPSNHFGLLDMHGNVWEWCANWYDAGYYATGPRKDPPGPEAGPFRVLRGGSWRNQAATCRAAYRNALPPHQRQPFVGFRLVLIAPEGG
jgi:formylglycine-generating enzyme required for sulfatase activity